MPAERQPTPPPITSAIDPDLADVRAFIEGMIAKGAVAMLVAALLSLLTRMRDLNTELMRRVAGRNRKRPPSETMRRLQLELPLTLGPAANDGASPVRPPGKKKRGPKVPHKHGRPEPPAHLERVPVARNVEGAARMCPDCHVEAKRVGIKTSWKIDVRPASFIALEEQVETVACPRCDHYIRTADRPDQVVDRGILGEELLVQAMVDHYADAVPWERMERNAREQGVPLAANTVASSVGRLIDLYAPIVAHIREACLSSSYAALDATSMKVIDADHPLGIRTGALWLVEGDHRYASFFYAPTAGADHLAEFLKGRSLKSVMCDGSATNNCVERAGGARGGCNSHGRRRLVEALRGGDARAVEGIVIYGRVFDVDAESKRLGESLDERLARRQRDSAPAVAKLREWVDLRCQDVEPKSKLGEAIGYLHRQWKRLTAFLHDPAMDLTNNEVERDLRPWVLDRKTWYFVGHEASARRTADALTLITTCRKMGISPRRYLRESLRRLLAGEKVLANLLPEAFVPPAKADAAADAAA